MSQINESAIATPGVYVTEIPAFPPSVAQVATAIPIFVGYAPQAVQNGKPVFNTAVRISSLVEFTTYFGTGFDNLKANVTLTPTADGVASVYFQNSSLTSGTIGFQLFNAIQLFFDQGGSNCYILAIPFGTSSPEITDFLPVAAGTKTIFDIIQKEDEPTLIVIPDAVLFGINDFSNLMNGALQLCGQMQDRFTIMDVLNGDKDHDGSSTDPIPAFRTAVSNPALNYGAAYYPYLRTSLPYTPTDPTSFAYADINIYESGGTTPVNGSTVLNSTAANQIELADTDMGAKITPFINDPNLTALPGPFTPTTLGAAIGKAPVSAGFGMIPQAPQVTSKIEITNKMTYIDELLKAFESLTGFTDNQPTTSTQTIYNKYIAASPSSTTPAYTPIELLLKELYLLNESYPDGTDHASQLLGSLTSTVSYTNINLTNIPSDVTIYGPAANDDAYVAVTRPRIVTLYNNVLNYINSFVSDVNNRINGLDQQLAAASPLYTLIKNAIANEGLVVPPCGAMAGVYAAVDGSRGVWKAPANIALNYVIGPVVDIDDNTQGDLNIDPQTGKSINAIRAFTGKGTLVWGARTLTGNDNDFRYISVRRFFIMVEESVKLAAFQFVFEPNDANTWTRVRAMIENYLTNLWRQGALAGPKPEASFWVKVGLGQTMIFQDVLEGRMIVEIGMAPVRPAEFIILRFTQIQQTA